MDLTISEKTTEVTADAFIPADHLLGIVKRVISSMENTCITLPGKGEMVLFPERREYYCNIQDMPQFCGAPADQFISTVISDAASSDSSIPRKNINDLLWQSAFHVSQGRLLEGCSKYDVVQLRYWPNLTRLPVTPNAARICALLTRHPTTIMLVHRVLGIDKEEVYQIYSAAKSAGITHTISRTPDSTPLEIATEPQPEATQNRGLFRALFAKISGL